MVKSTAINTNGYDLSFFCSVIRRILITIEITPTCYMKKLSWRNIISLSNCGAFYMKIITNLKFIPIVRTNIDFALSLSLSVVIPLLGCSFNHFSNL
ncbi:MAG: hypothetical protein NY202_02735 [Mollicutes bacterium UO1]